VSLKQSQPEGLRYEFCLSDNGLCFFFSEDCDRLEPPESLFRRNQHRSTIQENQVSQKTTTQIVSLGPIASPLSRCLKRPESSREFHDANR
jgi:hypothetical protein